jgi:hypothetical protein
VDQKDSIFEQKTREKLTNPLWVFHFFLFSFKLENGSCRDILEKERGSGENL